MVAERRGRPPSVDRLLSLLAEQGIEVSEREPLTELVRDVLEVERQRLAAGAPPTPEADLADAVIDRLDRRQASPGLHDAGI